MAEKDTTLDSRPNSLPSTSQGQNSQAFARPQESDITIQTDVDDLVSLVGEKKQISMSDAAKMLSVPIQTVEAWSIFLEEDGVLDIKYKFTTPYLISKSFVTPQVAPVSFQPKVAPDKNLVEPAKKAIIDNQPANLPSVLKQVSSEMDTLFLKAYELMEAGKFDEAKRLYDALKQENENLPSELRELKREISSNLVKLNKDIGVNTEKHNLALAKQIEKEVLGYLQRMENAYRGGNIKEAEDHYTEIQISFARFPLGFESKKTDLQTTINRAYVQLLLRKKELLRKYNTKKSAEVTQKLNEVMAALKSGSLEEASKRYDEAKTLYTQLPEGFSEENSLITSEVFSLSQEIRKIKQDRSSHEFNTLLGQLKEQMRLCTESLSKGDIEEADELFSQAKETYMKLPKDFFNQRVEIEEQFLELENAILLKSRNTKLTKLRESLTKIERLLKIAKEYLRKNDPELAESAYYELLHLYQELPDGYMEQKTQVSVSVLNLFREILLKYDESVVGELDDKLGEKYDRIVHLLTSIREDLEHNLLDMVGPKYEELSELFGHLPFKFVQERTRIWKEIRAIAAEVALYEKSKELDQPDIGPERAGPILEDIKYQYSRLFQEYQNSPAYFSILTYIREKYTYYVRKFNLKIRDIAPPTAESEEVPTPENVKIPSYPHERFAYPELGQQKVLATQPNSSYVPKLESNPSYLKEEITPTTMKQNLVASLLANGNKAFQQGQIAAAESLFRDVLKIDSFNEEAIKKLNFIEKYNSPANLAADPMLIQGQPARNLAYPTSSLRPGAQPSFDAERVIRPTQSTPPQEVADTGYRSQHLDSLKTRLDLLESKIRRRMSDPPRPAASGKRTTLVKKQLIKKIKSEAGKIEKAG